MFKYFKHASTNIIQTSLKLLLVVCHAKPTEQCCSSYSFTTNSHNKGCFWNPNTEKFQCPRMVFGDGSMDLLDCPNPLLQSCKENFWKCEDLCIPINTTCKGKCMKDLAFKCGDICNAISKPCNGTCFKDDWIDCNGTCLHPHLDKVWQCQNNCISRAESCNGKKCKFLKILKFISSEIWCYSLLSKMLPSKNSVNGFCR